MSLAVVNGGEETILARIWYSLLPPAFIALILLGLCFDAPWLGLFMGAVAVPTADAIIGRREAPLTGPGVSEVRVAVVALLAVLTWESPFWLSERITFNMTRHAADHFSPMTEPGRLSRVRSGPQMPLSYGMMIIIAVWPPLFRSMMEPRHAFVE